MHWLMQDGEVPAILLGHQRLHDHCQWRVGAQ
jgi:hypothetical protein